MIKDRTKVGVAHIGGSTLHYVHTHVKIFNGEGAQNYPIFKLAQNLSKSDKSTKQTKNMSISSFGDDDVGVRSTIFTQPLTPLN